MVKRSISYKEYKKLKQWYSEELLRRDKEIERLKKEKDAILRSALRQAEISLEKKEKKK